MSDTSPTIQAEIPGLGKFALQDLTRDKLLLAAPRQDLSGVQVPSLGGIHILRKLGQGAMGAVYLAFHSRLHKKVAVKVLPFTLADDNPEMVQRFVREARIAAKVESPHLLSVLDVNEDQDLFYIVMEFIQGRSAGDYLEELASRGRFGLDEDEALDLLIAVAQGLQAAHASNVIHRDIKPDNIMVPAAGAPQGKALNFAAAKLADLGLARNLEAGQSLTADQLAMGTPGYMAPEQSMDAKRAGPHSDIFSMGATLYAALTYRIPFSGSTPMAALMKTINDPHEPVTKHRPDIAPGTAALIDRCLQKEPGQRFAHCGELLQALRDCRAALGSNTVPQSVVGITMAVPGGTAAVARASAAGGAPQRTTVPRAGARRQSAATAASGSLAPSAQGGSMPPRLPSSPSAATAPTMRRPIRAESPGVSTGNILALGGLAGLVVVVLGYMLFSGGGKTPPATAANGANAKTPAVASAAKTPVLPAHDEKKHRADMEKYQHAIQEGMLALAHKNWSEAERAYLAARAANGGETSVAIEEGLAKARAGARQAIQQQTIAQQPEQPHQPEDGFAQPGKLNPNELAQQEQPPPGPGRMEQQPQPGQDPADAMRERDGIVPGVMPPKLGGDGLPKDDPNYDKYEALLVKGYEYLQKKDWEAAKKTFAEAQALGPARDRRLHEGTRNAYTKNGTDNTEMPPPPPGGGRLGPRGGQGPGGGPGGGPRPGGGMGPGGEGGMERR